MDYKATKILGANNAIVITAESSKATKTIALDGDNDLTICQSWQVDKATDSVNEANKSNAPKANESNEANKADMVDVADEAIDIAEADEVNEAKADEANEAAYEANAEAEILRVTRPMSGHSH